MWFNALRWKGEGGGRSLGPRDQERSKGGGRKDRMSHAMDGLFCASDAEMRRSEWIDELGSVG